MNHNVNCGCASVGSLIIEIPNSGRDDGGGCGVGLGILGAGYTRDVSTFLNFAVNLKLFKKINSILLIYLAVPCSMWDLSSLTRDQTCAPCGESAES